MSARRERPSLARAAIEIARPWFARLCLATASVVVMTTFRGVRAGQALPSA